MSEPQSQKSFGDHLRATLVLGVPLVVMQIAFMLINVTDTLMLGWLGVTELAAGTLAFQTLFVFYIFAIGFSGALLPLIAQVMGQGDTRAVRRFARMGLWVLLILAFCFMVPLLFTREILISLGQRSDLAELAQRYMTIAQWSLIPAFLLAGLRSFLTSLERTQAILWVTIGMTILNGVLNYGLIFGNFGFPRLEMEGAAIATVITNAAAFAGIAIYVWLGSATREYEIFVRLWRPDWPAFTKICQLGLPISLTILAEAGMFSATSLMMGWIGTVPLAAHGIALQLASLAFMVPLGLSQVASVRVGNAYGRLDRPAIGHAGYAVFVLGTGFAVLSAILFLVVPEPLVRLFLDDQNLQASDVIFYAVPLLWMAAAFQIFDSGQVAAAGSLRGLQDTKIPMIIATLSYWIVGMGAAYVLAFSFGWGSVGVWGGLVAGLGVAAIALCVRFWRRESLGLLPAVA